MTPEEIKQNSKDVETVSRRSFLKLAGITLAGVLTGTIFRSKESTEAVDTIQNPIYFTNPDNKQVRWYVIHGTSGILPNDPDRPTDTVEVSIENNYSYSFQTKNSLYQEVTNGTATRAVIDAQIVDTATWKGYMATAVMIDNIAYQRIELIANVNNPTDYGDEARILFQAGIGHIAQKGALGNFYMGQDAQGKYLDLVITSAVNPAENGTYRTRLDSQGKFSGSSIKVASAEPSPSPTPPTATPSPTATAVPRRLLLPMIMTSEKK